MKQITLTWFLPLTIVLIMLCLMGMIKTPGQSTPVLSVVMLCEKDGEAILVRCGGSSAVFAAGDETDYPVLKDYLKHIGCQELDLLASADGSAMPEDTALPVTMTAGFSELDGSLIRIGAAECTLHTGDSGTTLTVDYEGREMPFRLDELKLNSHSIQILCDSEDMTVRPDFSSWFE